MHAFDIVVHPARRQPRKTALLVIYLCAMALLLGRLVLPDDAPPIELATLAALLLIAFVFTLRRWFLATVFHFADDGLRVVFMNKTTHYPWGRFRSYRLEPRRGIFLSPSRDPGAFDRWRGVFVYLRDFVVSVNGGPASEQLSTHLEQFLSEHIRTI